MTPISMTPTKKIAIPRAEQTQQGVALSSSVLAASGTRARAEHSFCWRGWIRSELWAAVRRRQAQEG